MTESPKTYRHGMRTWPARHPAEADDARRQPFWKESRPTETKDECCQCASKHWAKQNKTQSPVSKALPRTCQNTNEARPVPYVGTTFNAHKNKPTREPSPQTSCAVPHHTNSSVLDKYHPRPLTRDQNMKEEPFPPKKHLRQQGVWFALFHSLPFAT